MDTLTDIQQQQLRAEAKRIQDAGHCKDDLRTWFNKVWKMDWRFKKDKARPQPTEVRVSIARVDALPPEGFDEKDHPAVIHANGASAPTGPVYPGEKKTTERIAHYPEVANRRILTNEEYQERRQRQGEEAQEMRRQELLRQAQQRMKPQ